VVSTSTRNLPNRPGQGADVYLASAELAAVAAVLGKLPTVDEYMAYAGKIDSMGPEIYRYLSFDKMDEYIESAKRGKEMAVELVARSGFREGNIARVQPRAFAAGKGKAAISTTTRRRP